jgi:hypothetical protein
VRAGRGYDFEVSGQTPKEGAPVDAKTRQAREEAEERAGLRRELEKLKREREEIFREEQEIEKRIRGLRPKDFWDQPGKHRPPEARPGRH